MNFSIITVNYNNREGLRKTIESVICQTFKDYEFIVIDGGSTDGSADILREYDCHITYWVSEPDNGIYNAMNKGIAKATGDYLNFMNSGDCFYDTSVLQRVADYDSKADIITGRDYHFSEEKQLGHASVQPLRLTMMHFFIATLDHQSSFIRRELFAKSTYREDYQLVSDWIFFTEKVVTEGRQVQLIPDIVCRREEGGISQQQRYLNHKEIDDYLHRLLPQGIYADYATLAYLDRTSIERLFAILENKKMRKRLVLFIKILHKLFRI